MSKCSFVPWVGKSWLPVYNSARIHPRDQMSDLSSHFHHPSITSGPLYCLVLMIPVQFSVSYVADPKSMILTSLHQMRMLLRKKFHKFNLTYVHQGTLKGFCDNLSLSLFEYVKVIDPSLFFSHFIFSLKTLTYA